MACEDYVNVLAAQQTRSFQLYLSPSLSLSLRSEILLPRLSTSTVAIESADRPFFSSTSIASDDSFFEPVDYVQVVEDSAKYFDV